MSIEILKKEIQKLTEKLEKCQEKLGILLVKKMNINATYKIGYMDIDEYLSNTLEPAEIDFDFPLWDDNPIFKYDYAILIPKDGHHGDTIMTAYEPLIVSKNDLIVNGIINTNGTIV